MSLGFLSGLLGLFGGITLFFFGGVGIGSGEYI